MRLATFKHQGREYIGVVTGDQVVILDPEINGVAAPQLGQTAGGASADWTQEMVAFIEAGEHALEYARQVERRAGEGKVKPEATLSLAAVTLRAPLRPRRNIVCVGRNYHEHIVEGDRVWTRAPGVSEKCIFFTKATETLNHPGAPVSGWGLTEQLDYEVELALIIGLGGRDIPKERARDHIFAYTILNDVTARDLQEAHRQWFKGKSLDGTCPMGPWLVTAEELEWPVEIAARMYVNDELRQDLNTRDMIWDIPSIIAELSAGFTLLPGDIIATGTGAGVAIAYDPPRFLQKGDIMRAEIEGIGVLENPIV